METKFASAWRALKLEVVNLVAYDGKTRVFKETIDRLFYWYAEQDFSTDRFDDISAMPGQHEQPAGHMECLMCHGDHTT